MVPVPVLYCRLECACGQHFEKENQTAVICSFRTYLSLSGIRYDTDGFTSGRRSSSSTRGAMPSAYKNKHRIERFRFSIKIRKTSYMHSVHPTKFNKPTTRARSRGTYINQSQFTKRNLQHFLRPYTETHTTLAKQKKQSAIKITS